MILSINDTSTNVGDVAAIGVTAATFINWLPTVSVTLSIIWVILRIYVLIRDEILGRKQNGNER